MNFYDIAFTPEVRAVQERYGSRASYGKVAADRGAFAGLDAQAAAFLEERDGIFLATVSSDGWPYVQFRGGPPGFLHAIDPFTLAFADVKGNRQYLTTGNLAGDDRVALIALDFAARERLKLYAHATIVEPADDPALAAAVEQPRTGGFVERIVRLHVVGIDWNCQQHITPRWSRAELEALRAAANAATSRTQA